MAINVEFKDGPAINPIAETDRANARREAAIAKLMGGTPQVDQNQVSAEELSTVQAPQEAASTEDQGQKHTDEASEKVEAATTTKDEAEQPLSKQYAIIARKEKALRMKMQELKSKEAELTSREEAVRSSKPSIDESKFISLESLQSDPVSTLLRAGISYDQITQMVLNQPQMDPGTKMMMDELKNEIKSLRESQETSKKGFQEQQTNAYKQAVKQIELEAKSLVSSNPDFEMIKETGSVSDVVELIESTFKAEGILLSVEEAAKEVEEYLMEQASKLAKLKKVQSRLAPPKEETKQPQGDKQQQMKTLTNSVTSTKQLSAKERAILAFQGKLPTS